MNLLLLLALAIPVRPLHSCVHLQDGQADRPLVLALVHHPRVLSGIPTVERRLDERFGKQKKHQEYKRRTSVLIPWCLRK